MRRVSRLAEQMFAKQGDVDAIWLIENADGEQQVLVTPVVAPAQPLARIEEKNRLADQIQKHFAENGTVRYARAEEMWLVAREKSEMTRERTALQYAKLGYTLANHPDRREVVHIYGEDATESLFAFRDIIRPAHGKAYLGKLGAIERMDTVEGRWLGLLPNPARDAATRERPPEAPLRRIRSTNELPADVGVEFITAVPDAPMQIRGRRDPVTGELFLGGISQLPQGVPWPPTELPQGVEIVTGPEAESLVLSVHRWLTKLAEAEGLTLDEFRDKLHREMASEAAS
jgi:hypothetical protein